MKADKTGHAPPAGEMRELHLTSLEDTLRLARWLAHRLARHERPGTLLLRGPLGSGKTTFACALAGALPGGENAETGSPSFTLCNHYPTSPAVLHADMYRCPGSPPDDLTEALQNPAMLTIVEWAEFLPAAELPGEFLDIIFRPCENGCLLTVTATGRNAEETACELVRRWPEVQNGTDNTP